MLWIGRGLQEDMGWALGMNSSDIVAYLIQPRRSLGLEVAGGISCFLAIAEDFIPGFGSHSVFTDHIRVGIALRSSSSIYPCDHQEYSVIHQISLNRSIPFRHGDVGAVCPRFRQPEGTCFAEYFKSIIKLTKNQLVSCYHHVQEILNDLSDKDTPPPWGGPSPQTSPTLLYRCYPQLRTLVNREEGCEQIWVVKSEQPGE